MDLIYLYSKTTIKDIVGTGHLNMGWHCRFNELSILLVKGKGIAVMVSNVLINLKREGGWRNMSPETKLKIHTREEERKHNNGTF